MDRYTWGLLAAILSVSTNTALAAPSPSIRAIVEPQGVRFPSPVANHAFCDASLRVVVLLQDGSVITVDSNAKATLLTSVGHVGYKNTLACNASDQIVVTRGADLTTIDPKGGTSTDKLTIEPFVVRVLDDGKLGYVDPNGTVARYDGLQVIDTWAPPTPTKKAYMKMWLSPDGQSLATSLNGTITVWDTTGATHSGPSGYTAQWDPDGKSLLVLVNNKGLARWKVGDPATTFTILDSAVRGWNLHVAGRRVISGAMRDATVLELDANGAVQNRVVLQRWPFSFQRLAAGTGSFAAILDREHAVIVDLTKSGNIIDESHSTGAIRSIAMSADGRRIAFSGSEKDVLVADVKSGNVERFVRPTLGTTNELRFLADGTLMEAAQYLLVKWAQDGTPTETRGTSSILGIDEKGAPLTTTITCPAPTTGPGGMPAPNPLPPGRQPKPTNILQHGKYQAVRCIGSIIFAKDGTEIAKSASFVSAYAIAGKTPKLVFAKSTQLNVADAKGTRELAITTSPIMTIAVSKDRRLAAIATLNGDILIWDIDAEKQLLAATNPRGNTTAMAWSPNGKELVIASTYAVDLVTLPKLR